MSMIHRDHLYPLPQFLWVGTLYIDTTIGRVVSSDLLIPGGLFAPLNVIGIQNTSPNGTGLLYEVHFSNTSGDFGYIDFIYPNDQSNPLIGHSFVYLDQGEFNTPSGFIPFGLTGNIHTPLPAALPLFASGLGALGLLGWRRKRKASMLGSRDCSARSKSFFGGML